MKIMSNIEKKDKIQKEALDAWIEAGNTGTVTLATGLGKTKLGIDCINYYSEELSSVLIIVPTQRLRDHEWVEELNKWKKYDDKKIKIEIECIQTAYKNQDKWDLVILDELHMMLGEEFKKSLKIPTKKLLGLTATAPFHNEDKMNLLEEYCPIIYTKSISDAIKEGLASPFVIINLECKFDKSERAKYKFWEKKFNHTYGKIGDWLEKNKDKLKGVYVNAFDIAIEVAKIKGHKLYKTAKEMWMSMNRRKYVCYNAKSKIEAVKKIIRIYPNRKWIIFCQTIASANRIAEELGDEAILYHSKNNSKEVKLGGKVRVIVSVKGLIAGLNIPELNSAIAVSYDSVRGNFDQSVGRICRFVEGKMGLYINLVVPSTQEEKWLKSRTKNYQTNTYQSIYKWI